MLITYNQSVKVVQDTTWPMGRDYAVLIIQPRLIEKTVSRDQWRDLILDSVLAYDNGDPTLFDLLLNQIVTLDTLLDQMQEREEQWQNLVRS